MADGAHPFPLRSVVGLDQALMRGQHSQPDPDVLVKLVSLENRRVASASPPRTASQAKRAAPFYAEATPDGRVACPETKEARLTHVLEKHTFTTGDLVYIDATEAINHNLSFSLSRLRFMSFFRWELDF